MAQEKDQSASQETQNESQHASDLDEFVAFVKSLVPILLIVLAVRWSVIEPFKIPSSSMVPTLEIGDHILVNKLSYGFWPPLPYFTTSLYRWGTPARGDVVVFTRPDDPNTLENEAETNIIKRVIGLPGDIISVRRTKIYINGEPLNDPWGYWEQGGAYDFGPEEVPQGKVFLMGDNRDQSKDSRAWSDHYLPVERIKGRAFFIYFNSGFSARSFKRAFTIIR